MAQLSRPRKGSLQFWPHKRAERFLPSVNWRAINPSSKGLMGFITYKVGMATAIVKDNTDKSMTSKKNISVPVTILEAPNMKIYSVRFYKFHKVIKEVVVSNDKELKHKIKVSKSLKSLDSEVPKDYEDVRVIVYSLPKQTSVKKTPDMIELAINSENKLDFVKSLVGKEISIAEFLSPNMSLLDVRGLTKGHGFSGPVKRFGITLKPHKTEKGIRRPGSLGPWHPARVTFRIAQAGQMGMYTRVHYNNKIISSGKISDSDINPKSGFKNYGKINSSYLLLSGSVQGPAKRQILITPALRPTKDMLKKKYEFVEVVTK